MINYILLACFSIILFLPLLVKRIEHNIELFLFVMAVAAVTSSHLVGPEPAWSLKLLELSLTEPIKISLATLVFGFLFRVFQETIKKRIAYLEERMGPRFFAFITIFSLGMISSVITAIIAALILCEIVSALNLDKKYETIFTILACFSIGMGAVLTPIGEPLSTIAMAKLHGGAYDVGFLFLLRLIGAYIIPGMLFIALLGGLLRGKEVERPESLSEFYAESYRIIALRAAKVYLFVMSLILLGAGFKPLIDAYITKMPGRVLYWVNMSSAVLDNATLAAAELSPHMDIGQIKGVMMGLIISGGMLIPGNIPNIISASKLGISSRAWAVIGVPIGLFMMGAYYLVLYFS
ncbi:DUF1646 family protein [Dissulfurimicrobium hydrothermale]|uniref:DUF1646 family protein n=1 Tax=Dissulfurimicrobium hydrothermale TaxID=1750598 RepID=UPI001EDC7E30|nr:DUF1646 family protein [Dissulfurimicrobium hydrothermale]UKL14169.1 DUF1646 domain-containing protein [Dissulfurimicrobium hydrothermale]